MGTEIVGRDAELDTIERWLRAPAPPTLVLEGEAGIGKTTLWQAGIEQARRQGHRVLACAAVQSETQLAFTTLRDLLDSVFDEIADALPPPQRDALATALLRADSASSPPDPGAISVATLTGVRAAASRGPVLVAIDDVQWVDPSSGGPLSYALRRLQPEPVAFLLGRRIGVGGPSPLGLDTLGDRVLVLDVGPLSLGAVGRVLHQRLGSAYPRPVLHRLHATSGGNPFYAIELARALRGSPTLLRPGAALQVSGTLHELIDDRLETLPAETLDALAVVAAQSRPTLPVLEEVMGTSAFPALDPAIAAEVVEVDGTDVRFTHPLFAAAVDDRLPSRRRELHERLAAITDDVEERARHLAVATEEPNAAIARSIGDGARLAFDRGSPAAAAELAREARSLTPATETELEFALAIDEVDYRFAAGETSGAASLLDKLLGDAGPGSDRARLLSRRARLHHFGDDIALSVALLYEALAEAGDDTALRGEIEEGLVWGLLLSRKDLAAATAHAESAVRLAEKLGDVPALGEALAAKALTQLVLGIEDWEVTMQRALSFEESMLDLRVLRHPSFAYGYCLSCADELDQAREVFLELERRATHAGDEGSMPSILNHLTLVECLTGRYDRATDYAEDGFERALEAGQRPTQVSILAKRALTCAHRGAADEARSSAREALALLGAAFDPEQPEAAMARGGETAIWTLGFIELSLGNADEAHRVLGPMTLALLEAGIQEPGEVRSLPDDVEALIDLGRLDDAEALLGRYETWARRLARPSVLGLAARCRGRLLAARGDVEGSLETLENAVAQHEAVPRRLERGRTQLALGEQQRRARQRRAARETLASAVATFEELGAELWASRARSALGRVGGRAPSSGGLTPTEQRVASLVAEGKANKEVAAELVVSVHTVESALTSIYRKLDVRSRTEMAHKLNEEGKP